MQNKQKGRFLYDPRVQFAASVILAIIFLIAYTVISSGSASKATAAKYGIAFIAIYAIIAGVMLVSSILKYIRINDFETAAENLNTEIYDMFKYVVDIPYAIVSADGVVKVVNGSLQDILGYKIPLCNVDLGVFCSAPIDEIAALAKKNGEAISSSASFTSTENPLICNLGGKRYEIIPYTMRSKGQDFYFIVFRDVSDLLELRDKMRREEPIVAYIVIDNLQELAQYVRVSYRSATTEIETILHEWASKVHGFIREYERDKYIMVFSASELAKAEKEGFPILETVREVKLGDNTFPVTISMGICAEGKNMFEREKIAEQALDVALQRGGDQVIVRRSSGIKIYGGQVNTLQSNSSIPSRVNSNQLCAKMEDAGNIIIMGHRNPDFDAIGATVGIARLALSVKKNPASVRIVTDLNSPDFHACYEMLSALPEYKNLFVDATAGLDLVRSDTLLIVVDVNNINIVESPDIAHSVANIAIIDHHRQFEVFNFKPVLSYIHPTASSTCELVSEMVQQSKYADQLAKEEATILLAGIMLDTKNFTHGAGAQTFSAVHYLYERGAHTNVSRNFFNEDIEDLLTISDFGTKARIYRDIVAITWMDGTGNDIAANRISAAKAADKLLTLKGIDASFALIKTGDVISISARSNEKINVQLVLEKLGGGGHFDMAGAQVNTATIAEVSAKLKDAIDDYLDNVLSKHE